MFFSTVRLFVLLTILLLGCKDTKPNLKTVLREICLSFEQDGFLPYFLESLKEKKFSIQECKRCQDVKLNFMSVCRTAKPKGAIVAYPQVNLIQLANLLENQISNYNEYYSAFRFFLIDISKGLEDDTALSNYVDFVLAAFKPADEVK